MIFFKYINLIFILIVCTLIGNLKSKTYENRVIELRKFQNSLIMFKSKIEFTQEPIKNIFSDISRIVYKNNINMFEEAIKKDEDLYSSWASSVDKIKNDLSAEDKEVIKMFGKLLGKTDIKGQVREIDMTLSFIEKQIQKAEELKNRNMKLYKTMGIISGLAICIILV